MCCIGSSVITAYILHNYQIKRLYQVLMSRGLSGRVVKVIVEFYNLKITKGSGTGRTNLKLKELVFSFLENERKTSFSNYNHLFSLKRHQLNYFVVVLYVTSIMRKDNIHQCFIYRMVVYISIGK
jgi:hypothetical protein